MKQIGDWFWRYRREWVAGLLVWGMIAAGHGLYAGGLDAEAWKQIVTWDEWLAAVVWLPWFLMMLFGAVTRRELKSRWAVRTFDAVVRLSASAAVVFLLDLVTRGWLGLGWEPF